MQGQKEAQNRIGNAYRNGEGVRQNHTAAYNWYRQSSVFDSHGMCNLGACYYNGNGTQKDIDKANYWWKQSAELGYRQAQMNLGFAYLLGDGLTKNPRKAKKWFRLAAQQGHPEAFKILKEIDEAEK